MAYITKDQWAQLKGYADWDTYIAQISGGIPNLDQMTAAINIITANIDSKAGSTGITGHDDLLLGISFNGLENFFTCLKATAANKPRPQYIPANYLWKADEDALDGLDETFHRRGVVAG